MGLDATLHLGERAARRPLNRIGQHGMQMILQTEQVITDEQ
jgi:hypothetical protein